MGYENGKKTDKFHTVFTVSDYQDMYGIVELWKATQPDYYQSYSEVAL